MTRIEDRHVAAVFQPDATAPPRALLVAGACGNVGYGKLGQLARLLSPHGVPVIGLDLSEAIASVPERLRQDFSPRFPAAEIDAILSGITIVRGTVADVPAALRIGMCFEAIPERLDVKRPFYAALRERDPEAIIFSATSGLTTRHLFTDLPGADRCGVMHPFFPHLTNKLWEIPERDAVTGASTLAAIRRLLGSFGHSVIPVRDVPAFAADRLFCGMMLEAVRIHVDLGLSPAQIDDACKTLLGTSPFFVHNLIPGANYLSAHCMDLMRQEIDSTLFAVPAAWRPYTEDPRRQWPYERGQRCPADALPVVRERMFGMLLCLTAYMLEHRIAAPDAINFLGENALAFRIGPPALAQSLGFGAARELAAAFLSRCAISRADEVAPLGTLSETTPGLTSVYAETSVHDGVGLLSLKRTTINHVFIAELDRAYERLAADPAVAAIVVAPDGTYSRETGHGADPNCFSPVLGDRAAALDLIRTWKRTLSKLRGGKPTVAALVGRVLGGGLELASSCHARIAAQGTVLGQPEATVGVVPGLGGCHHIHRFSDPAAHARISELLLTGHPFPVAEAVEWGFVSEVVPVRDLPRASMAFAAALAAGDRPRPSFREGPATVPVDEGVNPRNEQGVPHDADLRRLIASTVRDCNALAWPDASALEEARAADSLAARPSAIGVAALLRGKPPQFETPLA
jgi:enoyl-CoA hydratase/carnithine racemase/3-hydroxyacyl-CoA dehydrogenase